MIHQLKTLPKYFERVFTNEKTFELRKNDRDFHVGDVLVLREWEPEFPIEGKDGYTGRFIECKVTYIFPGGSYGLDSGYCILGFCIINCQVEYDIIN